MSTMRTTVAGLTLGWLAAASCAVAAGPGDGFLYGTVKTTSGSATAGCCWGTERRSGTTSPLLKEERLARSSAEADREKEKLIHRHWWGCSTHAEGEVEVVGLSPVWVTPTSRSPAGRPTDHGERLQAAGLGYANDVRPPPRCGTPQ
jgi:hypothetical protein